MTRRIELKFKASRALEHSMRDIKENNNRGRTYSTHHEVLFLDLGVEPEPNLVVVLKWLWFCLLLCVIPKPNKQNLSC